MIVAIARHELLHQRARLVFWLTLAVGQLLVAWLAFAQFETFADIAPQLKAGGSRLDATRLVIVPTLNSLVLLLVFTIPLLAMGSIAGERRSGRLDAWLASPVPSARIVLGKLLGLWWSSLPLLATTLLTLAALGWGVTVDWPLFIAAATGLLLFSLWLCAVCLLISSWFDHPGAALAASLGILPVSYTHLRAHETS